MKKILKKLFVLVGTFALVGAMSITLAACNNDPSPKPTPDPVPTPTPDPDNTDKDDPTADPLITFSGNTITANVTSGISVNGSVVTITSAGTYEFTGTLTDGGIVVSVTKSEEVTLVFNNVQISNTTTAPVYITSADKCTIDLKSGTTNTLTDAVSYVYANGETKPNACLYSQDDLTIKGSGTLNVNGNFNNGIGTKNDLKIKNGTINVTAVNNALKGNDSVQITGGKVTINGCDDGIKADATDDVEKGFVLIQDAIVSIKSSDDGVVAYRYITVASTASVTFNVADKQYNCTTGTVTIE